MNSWLLGATVGLVAIGVAHSILGERRIFARWRHAPPGGVPPYHRLMLRVNWHLPSLLGFGQAAAMATLDAAGLLPQARLPLALLALAVAACGALVAVSTRGRHHGGTALLVTAALIAIGAAQGAA